MALTIKIDNFEGPFDLLLHLIHKNKMDIYSIQIFEITREYMDYLKKMESFDLEVTSEFIFMASTLLEIKSNMLLPKIHKKEEDEEIDAKKEIMEKLAFYKKFKIIADFLRRRYENTGEVYLKKPSLIEKPDEKIDLKKLFENYDLNKLNKLYISLMENYNLKQNPKNNLLKKDNDLDKYKIENKIKLILCSFGKNKTVKFSDLIRDCSEKMEIIVTFLALLEILRLKQAVVYQNDVFSDFIIERI
ncbi:MAG: segregation/condensation protein A [Oscillospiraceae bacterium]|nr:segregation/condensation protein A [Oscillospiraceae bacterium]